MNLPYLFARWKRILPVRSFCSQEIYFIKCKLERADSDVQSLLEILKYLLIFTIMKLFNYIRRFFYKALFNVSNFQNKYGICRKKKFCKNFSCNLRRFKEFSVGL